MLIQGRADPVTDEAELARLRQLPLRPWAPGQRPACLRLRVVPRFITGRRIE